MLIVDRWYVQRSSQKLQTLAGSVYVACTRLVAGERLKRRSLDNLIRDLNPFTRAKRTARCLGTDQVTVVSVVGCEWSKTS